VARTRPHSARYSSFTKRPTSMDVAPPLGAQGAQELVKMSKPPWINGGLGNRCSGPCFSKPRIPNPDGQQCTPKHWVRPPVGVWFCGGAGGERQRYSWGRTG